MCLVILKIVLYCNTLQEKIVFQQKNKLFTRLLQQRHGGDGIRGSYDGAKQQALWPGPALRENKTDHNRSHGGACNREVEGHDM